MNSAVNYLYKSVLYAFLGLSLVALGGRAYAAPINSNTAFSPHKEEGIIREQMRLLNAGDDSSSMDRDLRVVALNSVFIYGLTERWTGILNVPLLDKSLDVTTPLGRRERGDSGVGDLRTLIKYRLYTDDQLGKTDRLGLFGGVEWPTGRDNESDALGELPAPLQLGSGSYDFIAGTVWTTQVLSWELDIDLGYKLNTEANDFEFGDVIFSNISYQQRLLPKTLPDFGVPSYLYGVIELNGAYADRNEISDIEDSNSGGTTVFLSPGLQWVTTQWVMEASLQLPVVQNLNGQALETDYAANLGFRYRF